MPTSFKFLLIPLLISGLFNCLAIGNIVFHLKYKFTMSLMSLNISLLCSFGLAFVGLMMYLWLSQSINDQAESPFGLSMGGFAYIFVAMILTFVNCVQAAVKRKGILAVFGLVLFLVALLGLVASLGRFGAKAGLSDVAHQELIQKNSTATFDANTYQYNCAAISAKSNPNLSPEECTVALWGHYFEQNFGSHFSNVVVGIFGGQRRF